MILSPSPYVHFCSRFEVNISLLCRFQIFEKRICLWLQCRCLFIEVAPLVCATNSKASQLAPAPVAGDSAARHKRPRRHFAAAPSAVVLSHRATRVASACGATRRRLRPPRQRQRPVAGDRKRTSRRRRRRRHRHRLRRSFVEIAAALLAGRSSVENAGTNCFELELIATLPRTACALPKISFFYVVKKKHVCHSFYHPFKRSRSSVGFLGPN